MIGESMKEILADDVHSMIRRLNNKVYTDGMTFNSLTLMNIRVFTAINLPIRNNPFLGLTN